MDSLSIKIFDAHQEARRLFALGTSAHSLVLEPPPDFQDQPLLHREHVAFHLDKINDSLVSLAETLAELEKEAGRLDNIERGDNGADR